VRRILCNAGPTAQCRSRVSTPRRLDNAHLDTFLRACSTHHAASRAARYTRLRVCGKWLDVQDLAVLRASLFQTHPSLRRPVRAMGRQCMPISFPYDVAPVCLSGPRRVSQRTMRQGSCSTVCSHSGDGLIISVQRRLDGCCYVHTLLMQQSFTSQPNKPLRFYSLLRHMSRNHATIFR
jgi:hypothetical protein